MAGAPFTYAHSRRKLAEQNQAEYYQDHSPDQFPATDRRDGFESDGAGRRTPGSNGCRRRFVSLRILQLPVCAPARASMFTGPVSQRLNGVWHNGPGLCADAVTLAATLHQAGYSTKWHRQSGI